MSDLLPIALITATYSGAIGVLGVGVAWATRRASVRVATLTVAAVAVAVFVAGLVGTSQQMFLSDHDLGVTTEVSIVSGVIALGFAILVGQMLSRSSRDLQRQAREFGESGTFTHDGRGPAELNALAAELKRTSERLRAANDRERRLEASRRDLVAWVSHDLRTPLAGMRAMAEALEDGMVDDPARYHARISSEVARMTRMVDDLFELSKLHSGAFELTPEQVPLSDLVSLAIAGVDPIARARGIHVAGSVEEDVLVSVDAAGMTRVLLNLLTNAIRHTPYDGSVEIVGRAHPDGVEVSVSDACGGIPEHELERVFDVAWRGSAARSPESEAAPVAGAGAGLGLAIVKGIVEAHRGTVVVENEDPGCRFLVRLPGADDRVEEPLATAAG